MREDPELDNCWAVISGIMFKIWFLHNAKLNAFNGIGLFILFVFPAKKII